MIISHEKPIRRPAVVWQSWGEKIGVKHRISPANSILRNVERDVERFVHGPGICGENPSGFQETSITA
jgi:hypothetical protein